MVSNFGTKMYDKLAFFSPLLFPLKNEVRKKVERSIKTGFQKCFLWSQNYLPLQLDDVALLYPEELKYHEKICLALIKLRFSFYLIK